MNGKGSLFWCVEMTLVDLKLLSLNVFRKPPVVAKAGKRRVQLAKGAAASLLSSASKF